MWIEDRLTPRLRHKVKISKEHDSGMGWLGWDWFCECGSDSPIWHLTWEDARDSALFHLMSNARRRRS